MHKELLGRLELNKIYQMDCLEGMKMVPDGSVDLIITDPPYLIDYQSNFRKQKFDKISNDKDNYELIRESLPLMSNKLKEGSHIYVFCSWHNIDFFKQEFEKNFELKNILIWEKPGGYIGDLDCQYGVNYEFILYGYKRWYQVSKDEIKKDYTNSYLEVKDVIRRNLDGNNIKWNDKRLVGIFIKNGIAKNEASAKTILKHKFDYSYKQFEFLTLKQYEAMKELVNWDFEYENLKSIFKGEHKKELNGKRDGSILKFNKENALEYIHPTQKPVDLIEYLIEKSSVNGDNILDCFMGSGTTAKACINTQRNYIGFELDKEYHRISEERIHSNT